MDSESVRHVEGCVGWKGGWEVEEVRSNVKYAPAYPPPPSLTSLTRYFHSLQKITDSVRNSIAVFIKLLDSQRELN